MSEQEMKIESHSNNIDTDHSQVSLRLLEDAMGKIEPRMKLCLQDAYKQTDKTTQEATLPCYQQAYKEWDERLNQNYQYLMKELSHSPDVQQAVRESERHWIKGRDEQFKAFEQWELAYDLATGEQAMPAESRGMEDKIKLVESQSHLIYGALVEAFEGGDPDPASLDKPL